MNRLITCFALLFVILTSTCLITAAAKESPSGGATDQVLWATCDDVPEIIQKTGAAVLGPYWYLFGGQGAYPALAFNLLTEAWETSTYPAVGSNGWTAVETNDAIYLVGRLSGQCGNEFQKFTPTDGGPEGIWELLAEYPLDMCGSAAAWDGDNYIYSAGGADGFILYDQAYRYDITADNWTQIASLPTAMEYPGGAFLNGKFYAFGGVETYTMLFEYDPVADTWTQKTSSPQPVYFAQGCVTVNEEYLIVIGGGGGYYIWEEQDAVQLYDPDTDTWMEETALPEAIGLNVADYVGGGIVLSTGGWIDMNMIYTTWKGINFPGSAPPQAPDVTIDLTASEPIVIPANGGSFEYHALLNVNEPGYAAFELWVKARLPDGTWTEPLFNPVFFNLPGGMSIERDRAQNVPAYAPAGDYSFQVFVGDYPYTVWSVDSVAFTKSGQLDGGSPVQNWLNSENTSTAGVTVTVPSSVELLGAYPNPFNPATVVSYKLQVSCKVNLTVYDLAGREVARLVEGWRDAGLHEVTFNASGLPSGIYFYRLTTGDFIEVGKMVLIK